MSTPCAQAGCRNLTRDHSGRCHHHRTLSTAPITAPAAPRSSAATWLPGKGVPHPTGGYDDVEYAVDDGDTSGSEQAISERATYYVQGSRPHRLDGPAIVIEHDDEVSVEEWLVEGKSHRADGPAVVHYDRGIPTREEWWVHGGRHRLDGPAMIGKAHLGRPAHESFFVENVEFTAEGHARVVEALAGGAPFEWARAFAEGSAQ